MSRSNAFVPAVALTLLTAACSLVTDFDLSKIRKRDGGTVVRDAGVCDATTGAGCVAQCGDGVVETGETCDPPSSCPRSCDDGTACTSDMLMGSAAQCNVRCQRQQITQCKGGDSCCPSTCSFDKDNDCTNSCGNGMVEAGETCDPSSLCPTSCSDGNACTVDTTNGSLANCNIACSHEPIATCGEDDGCCPANCDATNDGDCTTTCGNGAVEPGETCDPPGLCPTSCDDGNACTINTLTGSMANCNVACGSQVITQCMADDGCCPAGCDANADSDCTTTCDNGVVEPGETCDPPSSCPTTCNDGNECTIDSATGSVAGCTAACVAQQITQCQSGDGCCPAGCNANADAECTASCNNGVIETGETCDPRSSCPTTCNDNNVCTVDSTTGSAANCNLACSHQAISQCRNGDGCCPTGCNANSDNDCSAMCDNGVKEQGETCDPRSTCPTSCADTNVCTIDTTTGSAANCNISCGHQTITQCQDGDDCCPSAGNCTIASDDDCTARCGDGVVTSPETCDPPGVACPTMATCPADSDPCTRAAVTGTAAMCNVRCVQIGIDECDGTDGCCPTGGVCTPAMDDDCAGCGDGVIQSGETCDPPSSCPTSCPSADPCKPNELTGSKDACTAKCVPAVEITTCRNNDSCCPSGAGCTIATDNNCSASCGDGVTTPPELCDGNCPDTCPSDGDGCTTDELTGTGCNVQCTHTVTNTTCGISGDTCCPPGCAIMGGDTDCTM